MLHFNMFSAGFSEYYRTVHARIITFILSQALSLVVANLLIYTSANESYYFFRNCFNATSDALPMSKFLCRPEYHFLSCSGTRMFGGTAQCQFGDFIGIGSDFVPAKLPKGPIAPETGEPSKKPTGSSRSQPSDAPLLRAVVSLWQRCSPGATILSPKMDQPKLIRTFYHHPRFCKPPRYVSTGGSVDVSLCVSYTHIFDR